MLSSSRGRRPLRHRSRPSPARGGPGASVAARIRFPRCGTGSRTCCRTAPPARICSCWQPSCARTQSSIAGAGSRAVSSAWISIGRPPWSGSSSGTKARPSAPAVAALTGRAALLSDSGRGLLLVDSVADDWGTASRPNRRWVWSDVRWQAGGGPPLAAPANLDAAMASSRMIRKSFPGTSIWWGHRSKSWWAAVPGPTNAHGLICAPTRDSLIQSLVRSYPRAAGRWRPAAAVAARTRTIPTVAAEGKRLVTH